MMRLICACLTILLVSAGCDKEKEQSPSADPAIDRQSPRENAPAPPAAATVGGARASQAGEVLQAVDLWKQDRKQEAVQQFVAIDWAAEFRFDPDQHLFTLTEKKYVSLGPSDQEQIMGQVTELSGQLRTLAKEVVQRGRDLKAAGEFQDAEAHDRAALGLGRLLSRDPEGLLIVRLVGIAVQKLSLEELASLYDAMGEPAKLQQVREQLDELDRQREQIRDKVRR